ncbi:heterokaryon incompatibility protein-domain-containing protein [Clohesyomyces aquaticus]|uniref:Heterokaryon incompatibility protein-domain-containing protein n=1 Tax=Clohesyomyces aquaticus TaxID=1231657 RepID=A0A1Y2A2J4_9PLEO|nr:heterokaryon incompatibility protein-domain-containing protein [Clohesyomyces aquaticus]
MVSVCTTCKGLQKHLQALDTGIPDTHSAQRLHWVNTTLPGLRRSTHGGCRACATLLQGILLHHDRFAGEQEDHIRISAESFIGPGAPSDRDAQNHLSVEVRWKDPGGECGNGDEHEHDDGYPDLKLEFFTDGDRQSPFSAIGRGRHISENALHDSGLSTARHMINDCLSRHSRCRRAKPSTLPRRVLDVLLEDGTRGVRLHESTFDYDEDRYEFGEYLTLSHCWGTGRNVLKTTAKSLHSNRKHIPWSTLPKTFQDAVSLTRALGFRWLWIDSLCIVQDDAEEKLEASTHMDDIFANSFLTIAATSAADTTDGLFLPKTQPFKIQATDSAGSLHRIYVREQPPHYTFKASFNEGAHMNDWELPLNPSAEANRHTPLLRRAWAYAERLISPRVLHFTKSEMILECREGYQCECGRIEDSTFDPRATDCVKQDYAKLIAEQEARSPVTNGINNRIDSVASQLAATTLADDDQGMSRTRDDAINLWSYIITEYSSRNLTLDADRLVAIIGVAKTLSDTLRSGYIAGQWTSNLLGLLWHPDDTSPCRRPRNLSQNVPSWSWASIEGSPIYFDNSTAMDLACTASFPSERGRTRAWSPISGDALELTASMATDVAFRVDGENEYSLVKDGISVEFRPDISPPQGQDSLASGDFLVCVLVSMTFRSSIIGLVLKQSKSNAQTYRRVGRFECYECLRDSTDQEPEDAEALFGHWFPEVEDMTQLDDGPQRTFIVV